MFKYLVLSVFIVISDQLTKQLAENLLVLHQPHAVFSSLNFTLAYNKGAAFSLFADANGWQTIFFSVIGVIAVVVIVNIIKNLESDQIQQGIGMALILGGAIGNLIDRVLYSQVVDFIDVYYSSWHFATFNIADMAITIGAVFVILDAIGWILPGIPKPKKPQTETSK